MGTTLTTNTCYMAGLYSKSSKKQKNFVSLNSGIEELRDRFVEIAVKDLKILPNKIILGREDEENVVGFFHSRVAKQLLDIINREIYIFKKDNEFSRSYLAGMFDASGHFRAGALEIRHINTNDALMLEALGVHSKGDKILNISRFIELAGGKSIILKRLDIKISR